MLIGKPAQDDRSQSLDLYLQVLYMLINVACMLLLELGFDFKIIKGKNRKGQRVRNDVAPETNLH